MKVLVESLKAPRRHTLGSCGYDIYCPCDLTLRAGEFVTIDLKIMLDEGDIPDGHFAMLVPRSSTGSKKGLHLRNTVGIIDSSYTMDTIKATLYVDSDVQEFKFNDRILQMVILPYALMKDDIPPIEVRKGGYGSTGL